MCGRYNITDNPALHVLLERLGIDIGPLPERYNIAPTENVPCLFYHNDSYAITEMRWWLTPSWSDGPSQKFAMFNARSETVATSKAYRGPFRYRRAVMPASSFVEWQRSGSSNDSGKQPYLIQPEQDGLLFAALWDSWSGFTEQDGRDVETELLSCSMLTTQAVECFAPIHHRQPVMLSAEQAMQWLQPETPQETLQQIMQAGSGQVLQATPVDSGINNARNKSAPQVAGDPLRIELNQ